jgi:hypothetical protein
VAFLQKIILKIKRKNDIFRVDELTPLLKKSHMRDAFLPISPREILFEICWIHCRFLALTAYAVKIVDPSYESILWLLLK